MVKAITLFLVLMVVLAMFGRLRLRLPGQNRLQALKCKRCGRFRLQRAPCDCNSTGPRRG